MKRLLQAAEYCLLPRRPLPPAYTTDPVWAKVLATLAGADIEDPPDEIIFRPAEDQQHEPDNRRWFRCRKCQVLYVAPGSLYTVTAWREQAASRAHERTCPQRD